MSYKAITRKGATLQDVEAGTLKAVYVSALEALSHTHVINERVMGRLAEAVFETYLMSGRPSFPLSKAMMEELAIASIDLVMASAADLPVHKH